MRFVYEIETENGWERVSYEEYSSFKGNKRRLPSTYLFGMFAGLFEPALEEQSLKIMQMVSERYWND